MWVVKVKRCKGNRKIYRKTWRFSYEFWESACYVVLAIMIWVVVWYE